MELLALALWFISYFIEDYLFPHFWLSFILMPNSISCGIMPCLAP
uniref:Uncharacterized protein n=1 Tax=Rhizophora mucronata TaxID=61149 RepID=A0A2P2Q559_RHIMU